MGLMRNAPAPLVLDFVAPRWRRPGWLGWCVLALGVAAVALVWFDLEAARRDLGERERVVDSLRQTLRTARVPGQSDAPAPSQQAIAAASKVAGELNAPWGRVFGDLANARIDGLAMLELHAEATHGTQGTLRLIGLARTLALAFDYVELLNAGGALHEVRLDSHEWVVAGNEDVVRFTVSAVWGAVR